MFSYAFSRQLLSKKGKLFQPELRISFLHYLVTQKLLFVVYEELVDRLTLCSTKLCEIV